MAIRMDGKKIAAEIRGELKGCVEALKARGIEPCLAVILAGDDPASKIYVRNKKRACEEIGIRSLEILLPESVTEQELIEKIRELNEDRSVHAMLVQLPLPRQIDSLKVLDEIAPEKDADGFHVVNAGRLFTGRASVLPCTPAGCMELIHRAGVEVSGKTAVVVGTSWANPWRNCCSMRTRRSPSAIRAPAISARSPGRPIYWFARSGARRW